MKIAILLSTYNGESFLNDQLESIYKQTYKEYITVYVRDDGSSDRTLQIINNWAAVIPIVVISDGKNLGPSRSFWQLLHDVNITADYFCFCDQDDIWYPKKVETQIKALKSKELCICNCSLLDASGKVIKDKRVDSFPDVSINRLFISGVAQGCAMVFTKKLRNFIISKKITSIPMHDLIVMLYAHEFGGPVWIDLPLFGYRMHDRNVVAKANKTLIGKIRTTINNWKNGSDNSISDIATEMLTNISTLSDEEVSYLECVKTYKNSIVSKTKLICLYNNLGNLALRRQFAIRVLFNLA